jgi:Flp pilus assembly pilin Flp
MGGRWGGGDGERVPHQASRSNSDSGGREVNPVLTFSSLVELFKTARKKEEGQTMAEYAVVLAVITVATVAVFTALSGGISNAITSVTNLL